MVRYNNQSGKIANTLALKSRHQIQRRAVKDEITQLREMQRKNKKRISQAANHARKQQLEPGKSQARKNLEDVKRRSKLRITVCQKGILKERKILSNLEARIRRNQKSGLIYKII